MPEFFIGTLKEQRVVSWWEAGKRRRFRLHGVTEKEQRAEAFDIVKRETVKSPEGTIETLWDAYRLEKEGRPIAETMRHEWVALGKFWGSLRPDHVNVKLCREYVAIRREAGRKDGTIWTELGHLRIVLRWAMGERAPRMERPPLPAPKDRWLDNAEIDRLQDAAAHVPHLKLALVLMISTGARIGAILELTWDRVDFERGGIDLRLDAVGPRKGRARVPINDGLRAALSAARPLARTDHVIEFRGKPVKSIKKAFGVAAAAAGFDDVTPHVLRHTAGVHLAKAGTPMAKISQYLGHSSTQVTEKIYARFAPDHMRQEAAILDFAKLRECS